MAYEIYRTIFRPGFKILQNGIFCWRGCGRYGRKNKESFWCTHHQCFDLSYWDWVKMDIIFFISQSYALKSLTNGSYGYFVGKDVCSPLTGGPVTYQDHALLNTIFTSSGARSANITKASSFEFEKIVEISIRHAVIRYDKPANWVTVR